MEVTNMNIQVQVNQSSREVSKGVSNNNLGNKGDFKSILTTQKNNSKDLKNEAISPKKVESLEDNKPLNTKEVKASDDFKVEEVVPQEENIDKPKKSLYDLLLELLMQILQGNEDLKETSTKTQEVNLEDVKTSLQNILQGLQSGEQGNYFIKLFNEVKPNENADFKKNYNKLIDILSSSLESKENPIDLASLKEALAEIQQSISTLPEQVSEPIKNIISAINLKLNNLKEPKEIKADVSPKEHLAAVLEQVTTKAPDKNTINNNAEASKGNNEDLKNLSSSKEDKLLENIIKGKDSNEFNKVLLMSQNASNLKPAVEELNLPQGLTVNRATMVNDIIKSVKFMDLNGLKELTVNINPKELGNIVIRLTMDADIMKAKIMATNKEAYSLINSKMEELKASLENANLKVQEVQVGLQSENSTAFSAFKEGNFNGDSQGRNFSNSKPSLKEESTIDDVEGKKIEEENNINILA